MLDTSNGRQTLTALLQRLADDYYTPTDSTVQLNLSYPGGIPALEQAFFDWLGDTGSKRSHTY